jgi:hypothetical protein
MCQGEEKGRSNKTRKVKAARTAVKSATPDGILLVLILEWKREFIINLVPIVSRNNQLVLVF